METSSFLHARLQAQRSTRKWADGRKVGREEGRIIWTWQQRPGHDVVMLMLWYWCRKVVLACTLFVILFSCLDKLSLFIGSYFIILLCSYVCVCVQLLLCSWPCGLQLRLNILQFSRSSHECLPMTPQSGFLAEKNSRPSARVAARSWLTPEYSETEMKCLVSTPG